MSLNPLADPPPVHGLQGEDLQDEHIQGASNHVGCCLPTVGCLARGEAVRRSPENRHLEKLEVLHDETCGGKKVSSGSACGGAQDRTAARFSRVVGRTEGEVHQRRSETALRRGGPVGNRET